MHTRLRLASLVWREDKSEKNWSVSWSRDLSAAAVVMSLQRTDPADVEARTTTVRKGMEMGMARGESGRGRRGRDGGKSRRRRSGGDEGEASCEARGEASRVGGERRERRPV